MLYQTLLIPQPDWQTLLVIFLSSFDEFFVVVALKKTSSGHFLKANIHCSLCQIGQILTGFFTGLEIMMVILCVRMGFRHKKGVFLT